MESPRTCQVQPDESRTRKGPWTPEEDAQLANYIAAHGEGRWSFVPQAAGLNRSGKSCRLRWVNYLRPDLKRSKITPEEELQIMELHGRWGNRWARIAQSLPGRTDNEIKNYWRTHIKKKLLNPGNKRADPGTPDILLNFSSSSTGPPATSCAATERETIADDKGKEDSILTESSQGRLLRSTSEGSVECLFSEVEAQTDFAWEATALETLSDNETYSLNFSDVLWDLGHH